MNLNGILVVSQKVFQREVLLQLLEQEFYLPSFLVNQGDFLRWQLKIVGDEPEQPTVFVDPIGYPPCPVFLLLLLAVIQDDLIVFQYS